MAARALVPALLLALAPSGQGTAQSGELPGIALIKMPYSGARNVPELSGGPDYLEEGGIEAILEERGVSLRPTATVSLRPEEEGDYGEWHRMGLANGHLAELVSANRRDGLVSVGLLANCTSVIGVLGGLQHSGPGRRPLRVGLVFIDAHGDFNTPETTLSGMLGGMPVAVSAGMALTNLRLKSGLDPAVPTRYIVMGGVRDTDPLEQDLLDRSEVEMLSTEDLRQAGDRVRDQMERLSDLADVIYVHVDMDVLDPAEVPGHSLTVPNGPSSDELGRAIAVMFEYEKVAALGLASTPWGERDPDGRSRGAAYRLIEGAVTGLANRARATRPEGDDPRAALRDPDADSWRVEAPARFVARFETSKGPFEVEVHREWAPIGADRFYNLVRHGYFDDSRFFRVVAGFIAQFGIPGDPRVTGAWRGRTLEDDPVRASNERGTLAYAMTGPDTRHTQIYINLVDNVRLDSTGFAPFGRVTRGMDVVDRLYAGYGEDAGGGMRRGDQRGMLTKGNAHLDADYPELDRILRATVATR